MECLRDNFNEIVQKALTMKDPRIKNEPTVTDYMTTLQSQPMHDSNSAVDYLEEIEQEPEKTQDFSQQQNSESKIVNRHQFKYTVTRIKYSPTRIKSTNFLSNISYTGISKNYFCNENFILDVYMLLVKNLNPFSLSRKVSDKTNMRWSICSGENVFLQNFIDTSARRRISSTSMVEMLVSPVYSKQSVDLLIKENKT